ncbi:MAG: DUF2828 domain-containing protein [Defluviitaleaceae bacterium]|nr:DUF2828 domain-containing protein [Defluviitaleaceae bacterium]
MDFLEIFDETLRDENNYSITENFALGYKTTGKKLLDMNFAVSSLRRASNYDIINQFADAYFEDPQTALIWLFFVRDIRGGLGERRLFRIIFKELAGSNYIPEYILQELIKIIPEYGRFDDLLPLLDTAHGQKIIDIIKIQLEKDIKGIQEKESISLLAKWLPSINASSKKTRATAMIIIKGLGMSYANYRKTLAKLRDYIDITERKMSGRRFDEIKYESVPSKANLLYKNAFLTRDKERRLEFLENLEKGEAKINAATLYPHDIVHAYMNISDYMTNHLLKPHDETLEQLWKALPETPDLENTIVVADGSASMMMTIGNSKCTALAVANALAVYFAERSKGQFHDKYITFSGNPQIVDLSKGKSLRQKLHITLRHNEVENTDIYKVFKLILNTAVRNKVKQEEIPKNIIIISDMEFDSGTSGTNNRPDTRLFEQISKEYKKYKYELPRLIFWNVNSRTKTIPLTTNNLGVALVSGFSISIAKMVMSTELDAYKVLLETLNSKRYETVRQIVAGLE